VTGIDILEFSGVIAETAGISLSCISLIAKCVLDLIANKAIRQLVEQVKIAAESAIFH
jgi:hypothetical protein